MRLWRQDRTSTVLSSPRKDLAMSPDAEKRDASAREEAKAILLRVGQMVEKHLQKHKDMRKEAGEAWKRLEEAAEERIRKDRLGVVQFLENEGSGVVQDKAGKDVIAQDGMQTQNNSADSDVITQDITNGEIVSMTDAQYVCVDAKRENIVKKGNAVQGITHTGSDEVLALLRAKLWQ